MEVKSVVEPFTQNYAKNDQFVYSYVNRAFPISILCESFERMTLNNERYEATQLLCKMTSTEEKPTLLQFETPSSFMVCGPTNSGKAWFVKRMLENARLMFKEPCSYCTVTGVCGNPCSTICNRT